MLRGALPARFRKPSLLIVGCGDIGLRVAALLDGRFRIVALTSSPGRHAVLRAAGVRPIAGDLDDAASLARLGPFAQRLLHLAPPQSDGSGDRRTRHLLARLRAQRAGIVASTWHAAPRWVYGSTTGVYGDRGGDCIDETAALKPQTARAERRVDAERQLRAAAVTSGAVLTILRIPGIYDTASRSPRARLEAGTPALREEDDVYSNHIHADDLARACMLALWRGRPQRAVNVCDDSVLTMGAYFDLAADALGLPRPPRITREQAERQLSPMQLSFMRESRRLHNRRLKRELRLRLHHPTVAAAFAPDTQ
jgi:nucleoside-diphosphate-sugar epimerase